VAYVLHQEGEGQESDVYPIPIRKTFQTRKGSAAGGFASTRALAESAQASHDGTASFFMVSNLCTRAASICQMARLQHWLMGLPLSAAANCLWNEQIRLSCEVVMSTHLLARVHAKRKLKYFYPEIFLSESGSPAMGLSNAWLLKGLLKNP
jgi:hypothetical protein